MEASSEDSASYEHFNEHLDYSDNTENDEKSGFYSVYIPLEFRSSRHMTEFVHKDKEEAIKQMKKHKKARFKFFERYEDAFRFCHHGTEFDYPKTQSLPINGSLVKGVSLNPQIVNERISPFKGPKPQDLVSLRKSIETGDIEYFRRWVWINPRYLVSSGDTPSILQEGFRYNALHVAAKAKNAKLAELILSTVSDPKFIKLLYGDDIDENVDNRIQALLDLYLNTPDKGLNETPLHFAAKFGALEVVEVLVSFPQCDKTLKNKYGQTPDMIICDRCDNKQGQAELKKKIAVHLENSYYVPVLRAEDNSIAPLIGKPFSPGKVPVENQDPLSPRLEVHAYAGPMNKEGADHFRRVWKTPPRTSTPKKSSSEDPSFDSVVSLRYTDLTKGLERLGHKLAAKFDVSWKEYWSFLDCFIDITSEEGLNLLEHYLGERIKAVEEPYSESPDGGSWAIQMLCSQLQGCGLKEPEEENEFRPHLYVEKACNVFAARIASEIFQHPKRDFQEMVAELQAQTKQVELLILSYMDDNRFKTVNFSQLHPRLGFLTGEKLCSYEKRYKAGFIKWLNKYVAECTKAFDCFSSDDEGHYPKDNKPTSSRQQMICIMQNLMNNFNEHTVFKFELENEKDVKEAWSKTKECTCVFHFKRPRKILGLTHRSNSTKHYSALKHKVNKKLFGEEKKKKKKHVNTTTGEESSGEEFFTPPSTPSELFESDDEYSEPPLTTEVFVEAGKPTKSDCSLYKALKYSDCKISPSKYPNIYRWYHNISLYSDLERESWPRHKTSKEWDQALGFATTPPPHPRYADLRTPPHTPPTKTWLRITGANSPRKAVQGKINL